MLLKQLRNIYKPLAAKGTGLRWLPQVSTSFMSTAVDEPSSKIHFKISPSKHPLLSKDDLGGKAYEVDEMAQGDHTGRQQNHIWTKEEINEALNTLYRHKPETVADYIVNYAVSDVLNETHSLKYYLTVVIHYYRCTERTTHSIL